MQPAGGITNRTWMTAGVWIIATVALGMVLNLGSRILAPFAMAIFVWLVMEGFANAIRRPFPHLPSWLAHLFAIAVVAVSIVVFISVVRGAIFEFAGKSAEYEKQINGIIKEVYTTLGLTGDKPPPAASEGTIPATVPTPIPGETAPVTAAQPDTSATPSDQPDVEPVTPGDAATRNAPQTPPATGPPHAPPASAPAPVVVKTAEPPTIASLLSTDATISLAQTAGNWVSGLIGDMVLILIYVAFLYVTANTFSRKLDRIFIRPQDRERARLIGADVRRTMEQYLWVQTALSIITTSLTYVTLLIVGLDNALFWSFVIFVLNYIPTIGSIIATVVPALFAIVQPIASWPGWMPDDSLFCALIVFLGISVWQFLIGNFVSPRMTSNSLNLSALVVLLSLAVWGALWGPPGMFLSAPLTVLIMIVLAQIPGARWIAVLMSADGNPGEYAVKPEAPQAEDLRHAQLTDI